MTRIPTLLTTCLFVAGIIGGDSLCWAQNGAGFPGNYPGYPPPMYGPPVGDYSHVGYPVYGGDPTDGVSIVPGNEYYDDNGFITRQLPYDRGWGYQDTAADRLLKDVVHDSWVRLEYLLWDYDAPGDTLLGSPVADIDDPRNPFDVFAGGILIGRARVADMSPINLDNINGIRGTLGIPTVAGDLEANIFGFQTAKERFSATDLPSPIPPDEGVFVATSTLVGGAVGDNLFLYDRSFDVSFVSQVWGAEANFIMNPQMEGEGLKLRPLAGFRYVNLQEDMSQVGVYDAFGTLVPLVSTIDSEANNNLFGPQVGIRAELVHRWFTIGVEPKVLLGMNSYQAQVRTEMLRTFADPTVTTRIDDTILAGAAELGINARIHLSENLSLTVGYNLLWLANVSRPDDIIRYNDNGPLPNPPDVVVDENPTDIRLQGLSVGGELRFR